MLLIDFESKNGKILSMLEIYTNLNKLPTNCSMFKKFIETLELVNKLIKNTILDIEELNNGENYIKVLKVQKKIYYIESVMLSNILIKSYDDFDKVIMKRCIEKLSDYSYELMDLMEENTDELCHLIARENTTGFELEFVNFGGEDIYINIANQLKERINFFEKMNEMYISNFE